MALFSKAKTHEFRFNGIVTAVEGVSQMPLKAHFDITLDGDIIAISNANASFTLRKEQVTAAGTYGELETVSKNKSVIGRGIVGGAIAGSTGAIVGGLSGTKDKKKNVQHLYWYMCFTSSSGTPCRFDLEVDPFACNTARKFNQSVCPHNSQPIQL